MKAVLLFLLFVAAAVFLGAMIASNPGTVVVTYDQWTLETPLWLFVIAVLLVVLLLHIVAWLIRWLFSLPGKLRFWLWRRKRMSSHCATSHGLLQLIHGNWQTAEKCLQDAARHSPMPVVNYIGAAKAAHAREDYQRREQYLQLAELASSDDGFTVNLLRATMQMEAGQWQAALLVLTKLHEKQPRHKQVLACLVEVHQHCGHWQALQALLPAVQKNHVWPPEQQQRLFVEVQQHLFVMASKKGLGALQQQWEGLSRGEKKLPPLIASYAQQLLSHQAQQSVEQLLQASLPQQWDPALLTLYGEVKSCDSMKQLTTAEAWLKLHPEDPALLLVLGKLAMRNQLWGKAGDYLQKSKALLPGFNVEVALAELSLALNHTNEAVMRYQRAVTFGLTLD